MASRVYFPDGVAADVTPPAPVGSTTWEHIQSGGNSIQKLLLAVDSSTLATAAYTPDAADDLTDRDSCHRQYVSVPLAAQTISGNVKAQFQGTETFANDNLFLTLKILVCNNAGSSTLATLLAITRDTTNELATSLTNRNFPSTALSSYACADGDRIVIEVGVGGNITSGTGGTIGHNGSLRWGCNASSGDLPEDDAQTGTTYRPWLEFANTIKWLGAADGASAGVATDSVAGVALWDSTASSSGVGASAVVGAALWDGVAASAGAATDLVAGVAIFAAAVAAVGLASDAVLGAAVWDGLFSSDGVATVLGDGENGAGGGLTEADGASAGTATVLSDGVAVWNSIATAGGVAEALAVSGTTAGVIALAIGLAIVSGQGQNAGAPPSLALSPIFMRREGRR